MIEELLRQAVNQLKDYLPGKNPDQPGMVKLASNENPFGPSPLALKAIAKEAKLCQRYPDQKAIVLREALANQYDLKTDNFIIGNGSDEIMQLIAATFLRPGEEVIISENTFSVYEFVARLFDGRAVLVPLRNLCQDLGALAAAVTPRTKLIFICNPHNPTGSSFSAAELDTFLANVPTGVLVVLDEAYAEFAEEKNFPDSLTVIKNYPNVIVLRTFSKAYGLAGLRVGYGFAQPEIIRYLTRVKLPFNVNSLAQAAAAAALGDKRFLAKTLKNNSDGKKYLYGELQELGFNYKKTEANFVFIDLKKPADDLFMALLKQGVIIRPLNSFGLPEAVRVSIGTKEQNKKFVAVLQRQSSIL